MTELCDSLRMNIIKAVAPTAGAARRATKVQGWRRTASFGVARPKLSKGLFKTIVAETIAKWGKDPSGVSMNQIVSS